MAKLIFGNLPKLLIYIWDEKYVQTLFEFAFSLHLNWLWKLNRKKILNWKNIPSFFFLAQFQTGPAFFLPLPSLTCSAPPACQPSIPSLPLIPVFHGVGLLLAAQPHSTSLLSFPPCFGLSRPRGPAPRLAQPSPPRVPMRCPHPLGLVCFGLP